MKWILSLLVVLTVLPATAQQYQYQNLKLGMTLDQAKSALLIHYAEQQIGCFVDGPYQHWCAAYQTFGHRPVRGYRGDLTKVPSVTVRFGKTSNRVCDIKVSDPITPFEVFRSPVVRANGDPKSVEEDGNDLQWGAEAFSGGEWMHVYQDGGSSYLEISSKTYR